MQDLIRKILIEIGEDPGREGLQKTPERVDKSLRYLTSGYQVNVDSLINDAIFTSDTDEMVIVKDIELYSMCEHHLLPFHGLAHVGYIPKGRIIGLSKIPRIVDAYARRLQVQERLTQQVAHAMMKHLRPDGVGVVIEAEHLCMARRGVEKQSSYTITSSMLGSFRTEEATRKEFLELMKHKRG